MEKKIIEFNKAQKTKSYPDFVAGDIVKVYRKIKEGDKERIQLFEGIIIAIKGKQSSSEMITVRKVSNGVGVELILPIFSPSIDKIELVKKAKVRRAKLYYLRGLTAKKSRMKYSDVAEFIPEEAAVVPEAVAEEKTEEAAEVK
jgi:large subunit ribosomal protein L19